MYIEKIEKKSQNSRSFSGGIVYKRWEKSKAKLSEQTRTKEKKFDQMKSIPSVLRFAARKSSRGNGKCDIISQMQIRGTGSCPPLM